MKSLIALENSAQLCRITCGWKLPHLPLEPVLRYWRDVHSPSIARRDGIWEYRHFQFDAVDDQVTGIVPGVDTHCPTGEQLMWVSDVRYADDAAIEAFGKDPVPDVRAAMLADIDLIVDQSTTYRCVGENGVTLADTTCSIPPQGPPPIPAFSLFFRARSDEATFRAWLGAAASRWASLAAVRRLRLSLLEAPDMEAERASGYPVKTHPLERQYQAWIDVSVDDAQMVAAMLAEEADIGTHVTTVHAYPVRAIYTSNHAGRPTLVGLRGYPAYEALTGIAGYNQTDPRLLEWMYGDVAQGVTLEPLTQ